MKTKFKRKLIFELGTGNDLQKDTPTEYSKSKLKWECDVIIEGEDSIVNEFTISPDRKLFLNDFLTCVKKEIVNILEEKTALWSIKIYRLVPKKR